MGDLNDNKTSEKKLRVRKWNLFEVVDLDKEDQDFDYEFCEQKDLVKQRRSRVLQKPRKRKVVELKKECLDLVDTRASLSPELDTVRVYFACSNFVNLDEFIPFNAKKAIKTVVRDTDGNVAYRKEFYKPEMRCSWYGKMQVSSQVRHWGKNGAHGTRVLCFEYSVAKWYNFTSGINSGMTPSAELILMPCVQAMKAMRIEVFSSVSFDWIVRQFVSTAEIRRFDLSINFQVPEGYTPTEYVNILERCMLNRSYAVREGDGSISFGTAKSPYRAIFYDKEKEQKHYYNQKDADSLMYYEDESGTKQHIDVNAQKKEFYNLNKDLFHNKLRFEIQFRTKFMQERNLETMGMENIDNVLKIGSMYWREALDQFDEQLGRKNFDTQEANCVLADVLESLDRMRDDGKISDTIFANRQIFILDCFRKQGGWKEVRESLGKEKFYAMRKWVKENLNYDVKVLNTLPIMRIMPTILLSREGKMVRDFVLQPALVQQARLAT